MNGIGFKALRGSGVFWSGSGCPEWGERSLFEPLRSLGVLWRARSKELRGMVSWSWVACARLCGGGVTRVNQSG